MRRKSWKRILSAVLASAMIFTAAPTNLSLIAQATEDAAEEQLSDEEELAVGVNAESDNQTDSEAGTEETDKSAVGGGINQYNTSEGSGDEADDVSRDNQTNDETSEADTSDSGKTSNVVTPLADDTYSGPTIDYNPSSDDPGAVTFYFPTKAHDGTDVNTVSVKGGWVSDWSDLVSLSKEELDELWSVTIPTSKLGKSTSIEYGFEYNNLASNWNNDYANPRNGATSNSVIHRNPEVDDSGDITLYYYPEHGAYPDNVTVKYRQKDTTDYKDATMSLDSVDTAVYSVKLDNLDNGDYEYYFDVAGTTVQDTNNAKQGEFTKATYAQPDPNVKSPVIEGNKVTFYYYGPTASSVQLAGTMTGWGDGALGMTLNHDTGYWSITLELEPEWHEYKYIVNSKWINDDLNEKKAGNGNSYFIIAGLRGAEVNAKRGSKTQLPDTLELWDADSEKKSDVAVTYALSEETSAADYADSIKLAQEDEGVTTLSVGNLPVTVEKFTLTATDGSSNTATITVNVVDMESPVIEDGMVTFNYQNAEAERVQLAGNMNGWDKDDINSAMTLDSETGCWTIQVPLGPGWYEYKYVVYYAGSGEPSWVSDPLNNKVLDGGNSYFVIAGLANAEANVKRDGKTQLPTKLELWDAEAKSSTDKTDTEVTYTLSEETSGADYADKITLTTEEKDGTTVTTLSVGNLPDMVGTFTLTASDGNNHTSTVTVTVVDAVYTYTIYYYDPNPDHISTDASALWIWETDGAGGSDYEFSSLEELSDGNTWLKATVEVPYTKLSLIPKSYGHDVWTWQDGNGKTFVNKDAAEEVTLYTVYDDQTIYTELPEIKIAEPRYLVVEYTRETKKDADWQFYTWNSGFGSDVWVPFKAAEDGTLIAKVPVKQGVESISFCLARDENGEHWAEKDGNDYLCPVPADQNVVKVKIKEGQGIVYTYPYNTGYEIETSDGKINFYYRDDEVFLEGSEGGYEAVTLDVIVPASDEQESSTVEETMTYDAEEQRYEYVLNGLIPGDHYYRYGTKKDAEPAVEYVLDKFNDLTKTVNGTEYSVLEYDLLDLSLDVSMQNPTMDYNDNNVLTIKVSAADSEGNEIEDVSSQNIISSATVDLSAVGGGITQIDPELLEIAIAVKEGTPAGAKALPITVYDKYSNVYEAEAKVTVVNRSKGSDFDWDEAVIYFTVTDRFFDGNSFNNNPGYDTGATGGSNYHGGDFAGLTQKLDYLQDLGINTIWITPIVANDMADGLSTDVAGMKSWGYHGYWASDFEKLDSHLGTEQEFKALLDAAHARGIKIMVDVVLNHSGYDQEDYFNNLLKDEDGNSIPMIRTADQMVSGSDQKYSLSGLPDFLTENKEVRELLVEWQSNWISKYDIDYYRVDTVKHVDDTTWSAFKNALTLINPDFKMIGEWAGAGYATDTGMLRTGRMDSLLDFDFNDQATAFVTGNISGTESFMVSRNGAIDNTATLGAFLGSHDEIGFVQNLIDEKKLSQEQASSLALVAASLQLTAKGQVVIYYGEEIGMTGENNYPYQTNRYDFDWSQTTGDNATLSHYKTMLLIRNMYPEVFAKGTRTTISADDANGLDVFAKSYGGTTVTVALNIKDQAQQYTLSGLTEGAELVDYYSGITYTADDSGNITINVPAAADGGTVVLGTERINANLPEGTGLQIRNIPDQTYTGKNITLSGAALQVFNGTTKLTAGVDYTVSYKNNRAVGPATVTITGKGNFSQKIAEQFNIVAKNIAEADVEITFNEYVIANNKKQKPLTKISYNGSKLGTKDYSVEYYQLDENGSRDPEAAALDGVTVVGDYEMVIAGRRNFTGKVTKNIHVKATGTQMSKTKITVKGLTKNAIAYTGNKIKPEVEVKKGSETLVKDTHYTVAYVDNVNVGTAKVIVTGNPDQGYYGSVTKTFKITGEALSSKAKVDTSKWQSTVEFDFAKGNATQPNPVLLLKSDDSVLTRGKDYTVSYSKNTKPGTATVIFTGKGKYTGTVKKTFKVKAIALTQSAVDDGLLKITVNETAPYSKKGAQASVTVTYKNIQMTAGKDYTVTYSNNKAVTTESTASNKLPSVSIKGKGSFSGTLSNVAKFTIVKADLNTTTLTVADAVWADKAGKFMSKPVVAEPGGSKLVSGKDYTVKYYVEDADKNKTEVTKDDKLAVDTTVMVEVAAGEQSNYTGTQSGEYKVVPASIAKASVTVANKTYTGKEITLSESDFTKVKVGGKNLTFGVDYEIVPGSYRNNINKGNATVTIRGIGVNYGGEKTVKFKIVPFALKWWWN